MRILGPVLPQGNGTALAQGHVERVRQAALDGGARDPVDRLKALTRCLQIDAQERIAWLDVQRGQDSATLDIVSALDGHVRKLEGRDDTNDAAGDRVDPGLHLDQPTLAPRPPTAAAAARQQQHDDPEQGRLTPRRAARLAHRATLLAAVVITPVGRRLFRSGAHDGRLA